VQRSSREPWLRMNHRRLMVCSLVASGLLLGACGSSSPSTGVIQGQLQGSGGPAPGLARPFSGDVRVTGQDGYTFDFATQSNGRFVLHVPPGTYSLIGHSPQYDSGRGRCLGNKKVKIAANQTLTENVTFEMK
jgi:hypothetical protein